MQTPITSLDELKSFCVVNPNGCWEWSGSKRDGYGIIRVNGKCQLAHRFAYELVHGLIPDGLLGCHRCDNPPCCNPEHIFAGTDKDNAQDASRKGHMRGRRATLGVPYEDVLRCRIPSELRERFEKICTNKYRSVSVELRDVIRSYVEREERKQSVPA